MQSGDDGRLLEALRDGDEQAFVALVERYNPMLMRIALAHVPSRAVAEEVVQETWLGVLRGLDRFEGRSSLSSWLVAIAQNTARTRGRQERRTLPLSFLRRRADEGRAEPAVDPDRFQSRRDERPGWWAAPPERWEQPDERLAREGAREAMLEAIRGLPPRQRDVIAMRDLCGCSADEACDALGLSEANQRVLLHRARSKVRAALEEHVREDGPVA
jgi:RNA polymerase sigma-70 factor, ECF subfamily